jgi:signal transduction histidine kinase
MTATVVIVSLAVGITSQAVLGHATGLPLFAAVLLIAWVFGFGPAIFAAALGGTGLRYLTGTRWRLDDQDVFWLLMFFVTVLVMAWLASTVRRLEDERAQLLARERQARAEAEAASHAKDTFLAMVSHELRTPLTAVVGWLGLLRSGTVRADQMEPALETIERNVRMQASLIQDLLDVSRAVGGKLDIAMRDVDLSELARHTAQSHRPQADAAGVTLVSDAPPTVTVLGDAGRLQQVMSNLVSNAIKFTPAGGLVELAITTEADIARIVVRDTGEGIDPALLPHIFDHFRQGESGRRRPEGLGLGLAIAKHIVEAHGGSVRARSDGGGHGATFIVELPGSAANSRAANVLRMTS